MPIVVSPSLIVPPAPTIERKTQADARIMGAARSAAWGRECILVVSPQTEYVVAVDRIAGIQVSKSMNLAGVAPRSVVSNKDRNIAWVYGDSGTLVRFSMERLQPVELARTRLTPPATAAWLALGRSPVLTGHRRSTSAAFLQNESFTAERLDDVRSDYLLMVPTKDGITYFNTTQDGIVLAGHLDGLGSGMEAGAFDDNSGYLYVVSSRLAGFIAKITPVAELVAVSVFSVPQVEGPIQARVIDSVLHIICDSRNRWLTYSLTDPANPVLLTDSVFDSGLYWERNPVRWVNDDAAALFKFNSFPAIPSNWPVQDAGIVPESNAGPELIWILEGEVSRITMDVPDLLPVAAYYSGGDSSLPAQGSSLGFVLRPGGQIVDPFSADIVLSHVAGDRFNSLEGVAFDTNGAYAFSGVGVETYLDQAQSPPLHTELRVRYYDVITGLIPFRGERVWQGLSDGTKFIRPWLKYRDNYGGASDASTLVTARVSVVAGVPTYTASFPGSLFANPADPLVTVVRQIRDEDGFLIVELAAAPTAGLVVTIEDSTFPVGTAQSGTFNRQVQPIIAVTMSPDGIRTDFPLSYSGYTLDSQGHVPGTYEIKYLDGAFYDPNTNQFFCCSLDGVTRLGIRNDPAMTYTVPAVTWPAVGVGNDAAATAAAAKILATGKTSTFTLAVFCRIVGGLLAAPVGCTGQVRFTFRRV